jgi:uncharacterized membrane protein YgcG
MSGFPSFTRQFVRQLMRVSALALAAILLGATPARADERILSFDSAITVQRDGTLQVRETIRVRAEGKNIRRGIVREFPTIYPAKDGRQVVVGFAFDSATRDGNPEPWRTEAFGNGIRIYLGSASFMLPHGEHTYEIVYRTDRQMGFFAGHDELYWNVTGNGSNLPIDKASARVTLPADIPARDIRLEAYTGFQDQQGQDFTSQVTPDGPYFAVTRQLQPREGLTIVVMWPKGFITAAVENAIPPTPSQSASPGYDFARDAGSASGPTFSSPAEGFLRRELPKDSRPVLFALIGLGLLLVYYYLVWDKVGRDPPGRVIIPEYEMPDKQSAASMRYLMRMGYDNECFAASVLSLAVKGYLRIEQSDGILGIGKKYTLARETSDKPKLLSSDEHALLGALFKHGDRLVLEQENHAKVRGARSSHESSLRSQYKSAFFKINGGWHLLGILLSLLVVVFALAWPGAAEVWPQWYLTAPLGWLTVFSVILALIANGVFGKLLRAPTVAGQVAMDHIRGFKAYLEVAEGEDLKRISAPPPKMTAQIYEAYLPAALALDVEQSWAEKFARVLDIEAPDYHPAWYVGSGWNPARIASFSSGLGSSLSSAISSSSQAPGSKSGGGGGGRSGGGGGGGGVGGW